MALGLGGLVYSGLLRFTPVYSGWVRLAPGVIGVTSKDQGTKDCGQVAKADAGSRDCGQVASGPMAVARRLGAVWGCPTWATHFTDS